MPQFNVGQALTHPPPRYLRGAEQSVLFSDSDNDKIIDADDLASNLDISGTFSISFWINFTVDASGGSGGESASGIFRIGAYNQRGVDIWYSDSTGASDRIKFRTNASGLSDNIETGNLEYNRWYFIIAACDFSGGTRLASIYVNGEVVASDFSFLKPDAVAEDDSIEIGGGDLNAYLTQISFWESKITTSKARFLYQNGFGIEANSGFPSPGELKAYWKLNYEDTVGTGNVLDKSVNSFNLTSSNLIAGDFNQSAYPSGDVRNLTYLSVEPGTYAEGVGNLIAGDGKGVTSQLGSYAISAWVYLENINTTGGGYQILLEDGDEAGDTLYRFGFEDGKPFMTHKQPVGSIDVTIKSASALSADTLYHVTYVHRFSGTEYEIYVNASSVASSTSGGASRNYTSRGTNYRLGASYSAINTAGDAYASLDGRIYQIGIFAANLSDANVTTLYNSGAVMDWSDQFTCKSFVAMGDGEEGREYILNYTGQYINDTANSQKLFDWTDNGSHIYLTKEKTDASYTTDMTLNR